ncbi:MAG TPA: hypothetical protein VLG11_05675 [Candidatus Saccharimonadales bacterium]|nr:hypothetical protein [Candidatus Saccharimonadales bacterium]
MHSSLACDVVILPSDELAESAIALSEQIGRQHNTFFQLAKNGPFAHASLYMTQLSVASLDEAREILARIAATTPALDLFAKGYHQSRGYIDVSYERINALDQLQLAVVEAINPLRDGMPHGEQKHLEDATGSLRDTLQKYGYRGIGEFFRPHLTLARLTDHAPIDVSDLPEPTGFSGAFTKLGLFEIGRHGACVRKIAEFELGKE